VAELQHVPALPPQSEPPASAGLAQINQVALRLVPPGAPPVDVQFNQRQGEVHVVVRTSDETMQLSLRQDLPQLVNALDRAGFHAETFTPHASSEPQVESAAGTWFGNSSQDAKQDSPNEHSSSSRDLSHSSGEREQQQQRQREHMHRNWLDQMEE
jgi:hypothetical protein